MNDAQIASLVTSEIISAASCCDDGRRSPTKVARLLSYLRKAGGYQNAREWLSDRDSDLSDAVSIVTQQVSGHPKRCDDIWQEVLANLDNFVEQKGDWQLVSANEASRALSEVVGSMRATGKIEKRERKYEYK